MALPALDAVARAAPPSLMDAVRDDIRASEFLMEQELGSEVETVARLTQHIVSAGGKRLRPAMVSLAARAADRPYRPTRVHTLGAVMEMIHMATLIHDDVIDESRSRRGRPTANALFGNRASILTGDVLLSKAMRLLAMDGDIELIRMVAEVVVAMSEGEVQEVQALGQLHLTRQEHFEIVRKKTAVFIEACCRAGGMIAGAEGNALERLGEYGHHVGMAFQLADDVLDFKGNPEKTGKSVGGDFREGCATLPLIHTLLRASDADRLEITRLFGRTDDETRILAVVEIIDRAGGFDHTLDVACGHVDSAVTCLASIPATHARDCLHSIADFVVTREL